MAWRDAYSMACLLHAHAMLSSCLGIGPLSMKFEPGLVFSQSTAAEHPDGVKGASRAVGPHSQSHGKSTAPESPSCMLVASETTVKLEKASCIAAAEQPDSNTCAACASETNVEPKDGGGGSVEGASSGSSRAAGLVSSKSAVQWAVGNPKHSTSAGGGGGNGSSEQVLGWQQSCRVHCREAAGRGQGRDSEDADSAKAVLTDVTLAEVMRDLDLAIMMGGISFRQLLHAGVQVVQALATTLRQPDASAARSAFTRHH